uniref:Uncharacterized protein n=1 Tax=Rhizophora mucronata TaxID=61149 RepID=A0A2P2R0U3_RHIMU
MKIMTMLTHPPHLISQTRT